MNLLPIAIVLAVQWMPGRQYLMKILDRLKSGSGLHERLYRKLEHTAQACEFGTRNHRNRILELL